MTAETRSKTVAFWANLISQATGIDASHEGLLRNLNGMHLDIEAGVRGDTLAIEAIEKRQHAERFRAAHAVADIADSPNDPLLVLPAIAETLGAPMTRPLDL